MYYYVSVILSFIFIIVGLIIQKDYPVLSSTIMTTGGAVFGSFFAVFFTKNIENNIIDILKKTLIPTCFLKEDEKKLLQRKWHYYYCTRKMNNFIWNYQVLDFNKSTEYGVLKTKITINKVQYIYEFVTKDDKVLLYTKNVSGNEETATHIFPTIKLDYANTHSGIMLLEDWDMKKVIMPTIISKTPLFNIKKQDFIEDTEIQQKLYELWKNKNIYDIGLDR